MSSKGVKLTSKGKRHKVRKSHPWCNNTHIFVKSKDAMIKQYDFEKFCEITKKKGVYKAYGKSYE